MRYLNKRALGALTAIGLLASAATAAQRKPAGVPAVAPVGDAAPPADLPAGAGPSGTSTLAAPARFDEVGYAAVGAGGGISASGTGLSAAGFAEVTDLATGRTVLVKTNDQPVAKPGFLADLSPDAAHLLGLPGTGPAQVRVRQVEPIAADQVALEQGRPAAPRLDAPPILLTGLRAQMAQVPAPGPARPVAVQPPPGSASKTATAAVHAASTLNTNSAAGRDKPGASYPAPDTATKPATPKAAKSKPTAAAAKPAAATKAAPKASPPAATGKYRVRVGAFSNAANARGLAAKLGGHASPSGKFWLVELGPFADAAAAKSARDGAAKRGYGDARVIAN